MLFLRLILCLFPLLATPLLALLIAEGYLDFGGGEKDLLLLLPWILWSLAFLVFSAVFWCRRVPGVIVKSCGWSIRRRSHPPGLR